MMMTLEYSAEMPAVESGRQPASLATYLLSVGTAAFLHRQGLLRSCRWHDGQMWVRVLSAEDAPRMSVPTALPCVSPWNKEGGWYARTASPKLIRESDLPALAPYRAAVLAADRIVAEVAPDAPPKGDAKGRMLARLRADLPDAALPYLDACWACDAAGAWYAVPLLGSGGCEGRCEYAEQYMRAAGMVYAERRPDDPGYSLGGWGGGPNDGPWGSVTAHEYMMVIEGAVALAPGLAYTHRAGGHRVPWHTDLRPGTTDSVGDRDGTRGEYWLPTWRHWAGWPEVSALLRGGGLRYHRGDAGDSLQAMRSDVPAGVSGLWRVGLVAPLGERMHRAKLLGVWGAGS